MLRLAREVKKSSGKSVSVVNARRIKPLDEKFLNKVAGKNIITLEENVLRGGFGESVIEYYNANGVKTRVKTFAISDKFVNHASQDEQLIKEGFTAKNVENQLI